MEQARGDAKLPLTVLAAPRGAGGDLGRLKAGCRGWHARRLRLLAWLAFLDPGSSVIQHMALARGRPDAAMPKRRACGKRKLMVTVLESGWSGADRLGRFAAQVRR